MLIIAHRGASAFAPENTLEAIAKAVACGADAVEIDVQLSADGVAFVFHDDELSRCTNAATVFPDRAPWTTADFAIAELRQLDAGSWFAADLRQHRARNAIEDDEWARWVSPDNLDHYRSGDVRIPTLLECLQSICLEHGLLAHIELKLIPRLWPGLLDAVIRAIGKLGVADRCVLSSFDHQALARVGELAPNVRTAVLTTSRIHRPADYLRSIGATAYNPCCHGANDSMGFGARDGEPDVRTIGSLLGEGFEIFPWTANDMTTIAALRDAGVSGIYTDFPNRGRSLVDDLTRNTRGS